MSRVKKPSHLFLSLWATVIFLAAGPAPAAAQGAGDSADLRAVQARIADRLAHNSFKVPLVLDSSESGGEVRVKVYGTFDHPFAKVLEVLKVPANWCDIVTLHPNVKACTFREELDSWLLDFYLGPKTYQSPADAHQITYRYRKAEEREGYLDLRLDAGTGPFGTRDHRMRIEALALAGGSTLVRFSYAYHSNLAMRLAEKGYFATMGRGKVGFTVTGTDRNADPVLIGGSRGALERNAVRFYFAVQAFMDTSGNGGENRFTRRLAKWYDLTNPYSRQLYEMTKQDYLAVKTAEHENQMMLQRRIEAGLP